MEWEQAKVTNEFDKHVKGFQGTSNDERCIDLVLFESGKYISDIRWFWQKCTRRLRGKDVVHLARLYVRQGKLVRNPPRTYSLLHMHRGNLNVDLRTKRDLYARNLNSKNNGTQAT